MYSFPNSVNNSFIQTLEAAEVNLNFAPTFVANSPTIFLSTCSSSNLSHLFPAIPNTYKNK